MTKLERIAQKSLIEKAAMIEGRPVKHISKVIEHAKGATVYYKCGAVEVRQIPLSHWIGEIYED